MASLVSGIELLDKFGAYRIVFPFLLIFAVTYGVLSRLKVFGENSFINSIISFVVAIIFVSFATAVKFVNLLMVFSIVFMIVILLVVIVVAASGVKLDTIVKGITKGGWFLIVIVLVILTFTVMNLVFPEFNPSTQDVANASESGAYGILGGTTSIFFTPAVLGLIVLFAVFAAAAYFITVK